MRPGNPFSQLIIGFVFTISLVLLASCSTPSNPAARTDQLPSAGDAPVEQVAMQVEAGVSISATTQSADPMEMPAQDGPTLLQSNCTNCHLAAWLEQTEKPRDEWVKVLERMETMGVHLSGTEKDILLDYLAATEQP